MSVSETFHAFVLDQLGRGLSVTTRKMFGGVGIYADEFFFALIDNDTLYLKVDDSNRAAFVSRGLGPFAPFGEGGGSMQYYPVPGEVLDSPELLQVWASDAVNVARNAKARKRKPSSRRSKA